MILYTPQHLAVRHAAGRFDSTSGVRFAADGSTWATDGHILLRFEGPAPAAEDYPLVEGLDPADAPLAAFTLPLDVVERVRKAIPKARVTMPQLQSFALQTVGLPDRVVLATTDLESPSVVRTMPAEANDARWAYAAKILSEARDVKPKAPEVCVDARLLARVCKAVDEVHSKQKKSSAQLVWCGGKTELDPIYLRTEHPEAGVLEALLMPMRR